MKTKTLKSNLIANLLSYAIATGLSFVITPFLVKHLGKEIYSYYGIANNFVNFITVISVALNSMASKYIMVEMVRGHDEKAKKYYSSIFFSNIILCLILTPLLVIFVLNLNKILSLSDSYVKDVQILFFLIFGAMLIRFSTSIYGSATYLANRMDLRAYIEMSKSIGRLLLYIFIFSFFKPSIIYVGVVMFILEVCNSFAQIRFAKMLIPQIKIRKKYFDIRLVISTLKVGVWNSLNQLGDLLLSSSDLIAANILINENAGGSISIVKTMPTLISGVITAVNVVFMPRITQRYGQGEKNSLVREVQMSQKIMGAMVVPIIILLIVFGCDFYTLWVPGNNTNLLVKLSAIDISRMLVICVAWPVANLNIVLDKTRIPSQLVILGGLVNILSMILLTNYTSLGIYSILVTTLAITILFYGVFIPIYPAKILNISVKTFYIPFVQMLIASSVMVVCLYPLHQLVQIDNWIEFFFYGGLAALLAYMISVVVFFGPINLYNYIVDKIKKLY